MNKIKIADAHNDFLTSTDCNFKKLNNEFKKNNIVLCNAILFSKSNEGFNIKKAIELKNKVTPYNELKKHCIFSFENLSFLTLLQIDSLLEFSPFSCSLTWNYDNQFAGGALEQGRLTKNGKDLVKIFEENNIMIDTAHLNENSFWDIVKISQKPIFNSHTCLNLINHKRNLNIEQIEVIYNTNGFLGITFVKDFLTKSKNFSAYDVFKNIDFIIQKFGVNTIGIGSDFYGTENLPINLKSYDDFDNLIQLFFKNGYNENDIQKIFFNNFLNFVKMHYNLFE